MKLICQIIVGALLVVLSSCTKTKVFVESDIQIIPKPAELKLEKGTFQFSKNTQFVVVNDSQKEIASTLLNKFKSATGWNLKISDIKEPKRNYVQFVIDKSLAKEGYSLTVNKESIIIRASNNPGFIYGLESIRQLLPEAIESKEIVPNTEWEFQL